MYPCSNPELTAAVSEAGGIGILQPISLTYVHGHQYREGIRLMRSLTNQPIGMNALIEKSSKKYHQRMSEWIDIALEEGIRFFVTSLGKPDWVAERVHAAGGLVYHDVTELKWAKIGLDNGVDGLICVNNRAGGHAGPQSMVVLVRLKISGMHWIPVTRPVNSGHVSSPVVNAGQVTLTSRQLSLQKNPTSCYPSA
jgi:nitronate monooxygenase